MSSGANNLFEGATSELTKEVGLKKPHHNDKILFSSGDIVVSSYDMKIRKEEHFCSEWFRENDSKLLDGECFRICIHICI